MNKCLIAISFLLIYGCSAVKPSYNKANRNWKEQPQSSASEIQYRIYLIGDAGKPDAESGEPILDILKQRLSQEGKNSTVVFLGDNIYPHGLPYKRHKLRNQSEWRILEQLKTTDDFNGRVVFIPGNHDWAQGNSVGWENVQLQERFVEAYYNGKNVFHPDDGCPGPVEIELDDEILLVLIDTQWWLHYWDKPGPETDCEAHTDGDFIELVRDVIARNKNRKIVVAGHHPMYSVGEHGGKFSWKDHLFPLHNIQDNLYIPLPGLGSLYPTYRSLIGDVQDIPNFRNRKLVKELTAIFETHPNLIYANGHDHSLQYIQKELQHYIVSGSGCHLDFVKKAKKDVVFSSANEGFAVLNFYKNGAVWLEFVSPDENRSGELVFRKKLYEQTIIPEKEPLFIDFDFSDQHITKQVSNKYHRSAFGKAWLGSNYRDVWADSVRFPVFDIGEMQGGLKIIQKGGGQQTRSLRLVDKKGDEFVLRSIEKYPENALPEDLRGTFAVTLIQDGISQSHPYGAISIPPMAEAIGVYHTNPQIYYIPKDPRFGSYVKDFGGQLCLFEERPSGDQRELNSFGNPDKIINTAKVLEATQGDHEDLIDQEHTLRSRLFDIVIGDWDRHDDQWRWARFKEGDNSIYRPIPRDRDQAYFWANGILPWLQGRTWTVRKLQGFHHKIRDIEGLCFNARSFDRSFLNELEWKDWEAFTDTIQANLTDEVIEKAIKSWPENVFQHSGADIISKLKQRRDDLNEYAQDYYLFLSKEVDVVGTNKRDLFKIERLDDESTKVSIYKINNEGEVKQEIYTRVFKESETKEVRLYGLDGEDRFELSGEVTKGPLIRIIAGEGIDMVSDRANVKGLLKKTILYDFPDDFTLQGESTDLKKTLSNKPAINHYDRKAFKYNYLGPLAFFGFNQDDGIFIGGGISMLRYGFRKDPFKSSHVVKGNVAFKTNSFNFDYDGIFTSLLGKWDLLLNVEAKAPNFTSNFFGLGNNTIFDKDQYSEVFYNMRYNLYSTRIKFRYPVSPFFKLHAGGLFQSFALDDEIDEERFILNPALNGIDSMQLFSRNTYVGPIAGLTLDNRDNLINTRRGYYLNVKGGWFYNTTDQTDFFRLESELRIYLTFLMPLKTTIAARIGHAKNFGEYSFYQANTIGGTSNMRGFRKERFAGDESFYQNTDFRMTIADLRSIIVNGEFGLLAFHDIGRVWYEGDPENEVLDVKWHHGYGGGLWLSPFNIFTLAAYYSHSKDDGLIFVDFGFLF